MSKTGIGAVITIVFTVLQLLGVELPDGTLATVTEAITALLGIILLIYSQLTRQDLHLGLFRKE